MKSSFSSAQRPLATPLRDLVQQFLDGNRSAADELFHLVQPYLLRVVRRRLSAPLRVKLDSADIVQSVWADVWRKREQGGWHFDDLEQFRVFLARLVQNRCIDRFRSHGMAVRHEEPLDHEAQGQPSALAAQQAHPSETLAADELWQKMLAVCPPAHRGLLDLKRQGFSLDEIALRTGLHKNSVRRILYEIAGRLALH